jgi:hypothetical protein
VLDEATSAVVPLEAKCMQAAQERGITYLSIASRLSQKQVHLLFIPFFLFFLYFLFSFFPFPLVFSSCCVFIVLFSCFSLLFFSCYPPAFLSVLQSDDQVGRSKEI